MSWRSDLAANIRRIILMDDKLERLGAEVAELRRETTALDRRVVRIETLIEMARERPGARRPWAPAAGSARARRRRIDGLPRKSGGTQHKVSRTLPT